VARGVSKLPTTATTRATEINFLGLDAETNTKQARTQYSHHPILHH